MGKLNLAALSTFITFVRVDTLSLAGNLNAATAFTAGGIGNI